MTSVGHAMERMNLAECKKEPSMHSMPSMRFEAADLDRLLTSVFPDEARFVRVDAGTVEAAFQVDFDCCELWGGQITDELVNDLGFFTGGVAEFKAAYARCQAHHALVYPNPDGGEGDTLREYMEFYRCKARRFVPEDPLPDIPVDGGDLIAFIEGFTVKQMLAYGW